MSAQRTPRAFTLIELLIVVAIIAILAAIAVPNFLEAQTRARVSRTDNDLRTVELAMESYRIDNNGYPTSYNRSPLKGSTLSQADRRLLTTPIAYLDSIPDDIFRKIAGLANAAYILSTAGYQADGKWSYNVHPRDAWMTFSFGPDNTNSTSGYRSLPWVAQNESKTPPVAGDGIRYDPTNGTVSDGDIYRFAGQAKTRDN